VTTDVTPHAILRAELRRRLAEMRALAPGRDGRHSQPPTPAVLAAAERLGNAVIELTSPPPHRLNLGACADGTAQFALFGPDGRELEMYLEPEHPDVIEFLGAVGSDAREGAIPLHRYRELGAWLTGRGPLP
jgi:hypothetical protein